LALTSFYENKYSDEDLELLKKEGFLEELKKNSLYFKKSNTAKNLKEIKLDKTENYLTQDMLKSNNLNVNFKPYNVIADVESLNIGKYQPYMRFLNLIKNKLVGMGFEEMPTNYITTEFYNFDVLFQPQNHSARTWTDTYSLKNPSKLELEESDLIKKIKEVHEKGNNESKGWRYSWDIEVAQKLMPSAHGTAWSAKQMSLGINEQKKYFAIARVFRPDVLDATHLNEFNQLEGFVTGDNISFKNLLGLLKEFAKEVAGADEVLFMPCYYPFTEPSVSLFAKHKDLGLIELGGAGIFRPEITETLGIKGRVIAWGLGIDRLAMFKLGIKDIRDLFTNKLDWLRDKPIIKDI
jgi:phenylalanyl-tRNA synthetase alpha chain